MATLGELDRVLDQIKQYLLKAASVSIHLWEIICIYLRCEGWVFTLIGQAQGTEY